MIQGILKERTIAMRLDYFVWRVTYNGATVRWFVGNPTKMSAIKVAGKLWQIEKIDRDKAEIILKVV